MNKNPIGQLIKNEVSYCILIYDNQFHKIFPWFYKYNSTQHYKILYLTPLEYEKLEILGSHLYYKDIVRLYLKVFDIDHICGDPCDDDCIFKFGT